MREIQIGKNAWLIGVNWRYLKSSADELKPLLKTHLGEHPKGGHVLIKKADGEALVGLIEERPAKKAIVAAPLMANVIGTGIGVWDLGDGEFWVLGAGDRSPLPGYDRIVAKSELAEILPAWLEDLMTSKMVGDIDGSSITGDQMWELLEEEIESNEIDKQTVSTVTVKSGIKPLTRAVLVGCALAILGGGAMLWYGADSGMNEADQSALLARFQAERERQQTLQHLKEQFDSTVEQKRARIQEAGKFEALSALERIPSAGLEKTPKLIQLNCSFAGQMSSCSPMWKVPKQYGELVRAVYAADHIALQEAGASDVVRGKLIETPLSERALTAGEAPVKEWRYAWISDQITANGFGRIITLGDAYEEISVNPAEFAQNEIVLEGAPVVLGGSVSFKVKDLVAGPRTIASLKEFFSSLPSVRTEVETLTIDNGKLNIEGVFLWAL